MKNLPKEIHKLKTFYFLLVLLPFAFFLLPSMQVSAQAPVRSFTIVPPTIQAPLLPGNTSEGMLKIRNDTDEPVTFNVFMEDFIVNDTYGTPTLLPPDTLGNKYSAASWIGISPTRFTVPAHGMQELTYFMKVPFDARPGGHYAAVVYAPVTDKGVDSTGATVNSQIGTLFSVVVDGPISEKASVTKFSAPGFSEYGPIPVMTQIENMSDSHIRPVGKITVTDMLGGKSVQTLSEHNVFPEARRDFVNLFGDKWMFGRYTATLQATYGKNNTLPLIATVVFWVFPWKLMIVIVLFIIAAILGYMLMTKKKKDGDNPSSPAQSTEMTPPAQTTV